MADSICELAQTISKTVQRFAPRVFQCPSCSRKYNIPKARFEATYKCPSCKAALTHVTEQTIAAESLEVVLDELIPADVREAMKDTQNVFGRFVIVERERAFDLELTRFVRLIFVDSATVEKTKAQARLEHKNIAAIYDAGFVSGKGYVAMQLVHGKNVRDLALEQTLDALAECCDALEYAHGRGALHGSITYQRVIIDEQGNTLLIDFGLVAGSVRGDIIGIQELIPALVPELSAIRNFQYRTAGELGCDIRNFRRNCPINAYGRSPAYRFKKFVSSNRLALAVASLLLIAIVLGGNSLNERRVAQEEKEKSDAAAAAAVKEKRGAEERVKEEVRQVERLVSALVTDIAGAHVEAVERRKSGDSFHNLQGIPDRILSSSGYAKIKLVAESNVRVRYSIGRLYRLIGDNELAETEQRAALKCDSEFGLSHYELGILIQVKYAARMKKLLDETIQMKKLIEQVEEDELASVLRERSEAFLRDATKFLPANSVEARTAAGIMHFIARENSRATEIFEDILAKSPQTEDAIMYLFRIFEREKNYAKAHALISKAILSDKGNVNYLIERTTYYDGLSRSKFTFGDDPLPDIDNGLADIDEVDRLRPDYGLALDLRARLLLNKGYYKSTGGKDPRVEFNAALKCVTRFIEIDSANFESWSKKGLLLIMLGEVSRISGKDPTAEFDEAKAALDKSNALAPKEWTPLHYRATMWMSRGYFRKSRGGDPTDEFSRAEADLTSAIGLRSIEFDLYVKRGILYNNWASFKKGAGLDPTAEFEKALADLNSAIRLKPKYSEAWNGRGSTYGNIALYKQHSGKDPVPDMMRAIEDFGKAIEFDDDNYLNHVSRGQMWLNLGLYKMDLKTDPAEDFSNALRDCNRAVELNPNTYETIARRANVRAAWIHAGKQGVTGTAEIDILYSAALADFERAFQLNPSYAEACSRRAMCHYDMGAFKSAVSDFEKAAALNPAIVKNFKSFWDDAVTKSRSSDY